MWFSGRAFVSTLIIWVGRFIFALGGVLSGAHALAVELPADAARRLAKGEAVNLIVEYASPELLSEAAAATSKRKPVSDAKARNERQRIFQELRRVADEAEGLPMAQRVRDYTQLPMALRRFLSLDQAPAYAARADVKAGY